MANKATKNNLYWAGLLFGMVYFPIAAVFYLASGKPLLYCSNRLYRALIILRHGDWYDERLVNTLKYLKIGNDTKVLEVGCGAGTFSKMLMERGAKLKAIDINEKFINKLQKHCKDTFELCSITDKKYKPNSFDRIVMFDVMHHIEDRVGVMKEIYSLLKKGGYAIIWEGSDTAGEEHLPPKLEKFIMEVFDGETWYANMKELGKKYGVVELEPYCYKISK